MASIEPFRGVLYDPDRISDISQVVSPPYDMISPIDQKSLYERDEHNFVHLDFGLQHPGDNDEENRYKRSAKTLQEWLRKAIVRTDEEPAIYQYDQEYTHPRGERLRRRGFIALASLEELEKGRIYPHERTLSGPKEDRLNLMLACKASFSQVFSFYDDPSGEIGKIVEGALPNRSRFDFIDWVGVRHTLYSLTNGKAVDRVKRLMEDKALFIADGHHRYETALNLRRIMKEQRGVACPASYDWVMMYFTNMSAPGLTILPFHRLVSLPGGIDVAEVLDRLSSLGDLNEVPQGHDPLETARDMLDRMSSAPPGEHRFGVYAPPKFYVLPYGRRTTVEGRGKLDNLDVSLLHHVILEEVLEGAGSQAEIAYLTGEREIVEKMAGGAFQIAFFLNPTRVDEVRNIASAGLRMPPKSTNFQPKLISGLVFHLF